MATNQRILSLKKNAELRDTGDKDQLFERYTVNMLRWNNFHFLTCTTRAYREKITHLLNHSIMKEDHQELMLDAKLYESLAANLWKN